MSGSETAEVLFAEQGSLGRITLNRPKAINALTHGMIRAIDAALSAWEENAAIKVILIDGAGERGFCAGGDIRSLYEGSKSGDFAPGDLFFRDEYRLNARIAAFPKPFVAFMDGIVMGGGIGLSAHASHRVVTPRSLLAMPEVGIGFIPDVGGTYLLARAPGNLGIHAALTAGKLSAADAILIGLADVCVAVEALPEIAESLIDCPDAQAIEALFRYHEMAIAPAPLGAALSWIDIVYAHPTVEMILAALQERSEPEAQSAQQDLAGKSPTSLKVALRLLLSACAGSDLKACLQREYDAVLTSLRSPDFIEGVRAAIVDKDRKPRWSPATLAEVTPEAVDLYFHASPDTALF
jgi:enoyl-CoA hydratase